MSSAGKVKYASFIADNALCVRKLILRTGLPNRSVIHIIFHLIRYLHDYQSVLEETAASEDEFAERVAGNPIHAYRLMKRLYYDWQNVEKEIRNDEWRSMVLNLLFRSTLKSRRSYRSRGF